MLAGRNGPYQDLESPIRNTSHWLASFSIASILTGEQVYRVAANKLLQFLLDASEWQHNGLYVHRQKARKDWCNGVIGQAWVAEALLFAGKALNSEAAIDDALRLLHNLPFDAEKGAWERLDPVHRNLGIDYTYNHQSWFASVVAEAGKYDNELYLQAVSFLNLSKSASLSVDEVGVVRHLMQNQPSRLSSLSLKALIRRACSKIDPSPGHEVDPVERGIGYHLFVMYSLARLRRCIPDHSLWNTELIQKSLDLCSQRAFSPTHITHPASSSRSWLMCLRTRLHNSRVVRMKFLTNKFEKLGWKT